MITWLTVFGERTGEVVPGLSPRGSKQGVTGQELCLAGLEIVLHRLPGKAYARALES